MKNRRFGIRLLPYFLALSMALSGCGNAGNAGNASDASPAGSAQVQTQESGTSEKETEETSARPSDLPEQAAMAGQIGEVFATPAQAQGELSGNSVLPAARRMGDMRMQIKPQEPEKLTKDQLTEVNRAMRDYRSGVKEDLIVNDAVSFYLYDQLNKEEKVIYDAFYLLAQDPTTSDNYVSFQSGLNFNTEDAWYDLYTTQLCVVYDHPELWWLYPFSGCTEVGIYNGGTANGKTTVYMNFTKTYKTFEADVKAFNKAVDEFLADIESEDEEDIAQEVHDKLIYLCTYDTHVLESEEGNLAHTAFGALVCDTQGNPNYCVCDGYSQSYLYLLQQLGLEGSVVIGMAGYPEYGEALGCHAWSIICLNGVWYEVDATWDDFTDYEEDLKQYYQVGSLEYQYNLEMVQNQEYMYKVFHSMYGLSTAKIQKYVADDDLTYVTRDGKYHLGIVGNSQRHRMCEENTSQGKYYGYTKYLPTAKNTLDRKTLRSGKSSGGSDTGNGNSGNSDTGNGNSSGNSDTGNGNSGNSDTGNSSSDAVESRGPLYTLVAGTYYVSAFNKYGEDILKQYYGKDYYKQLPMFELRADASGTLYENGSSAEFYYVFDGSQLCMYSATMGLTFLYYDSGNLLMYDYYGNVYTFSRQK